MVPGTEGNFLGGGGEEKSFRNIEKKIIIKASRCREDK